MQGFRVTIGIVALAVLGLASCGEDATGPSAEIHGVYDYQGDGFRGGTFELVEDGDFELLLSPTGRWAGTITHVVVDGETVRFRFTQDPDYYHQAEAEVLGSMLIGWWELHCAPHHNCADASASFTAFRR